jgi:hypothetical protein
MGRVRGATRPQPDRSRNALGARRPCSASLPLCRILLRSSPAGRGRSRCCRSSARSRRPDYQLHTARRPGIGDHRPGSTEARRGRNSGPPQSLRPSLEGVIPKAVATTKNCVRDQTGGSAQATPRTLSVPVSRVGASSGSFHRPARRRPRRNEGLAGSGNRRAVLLLQVRRPTGRVRVGNRGCGSIHVRVPSRPLRRPPSANLTRW